MRIFSLTICILLLINIDAFGQEISAEDRKTAFFSLNIEGFKKAKGEVRIAVFDSKEKYTKDPVYAVVLPVGELKCKWQVPDLPYGEYAIAVYHDANKNGKLDTNFLGIPKERYGFSNNARGKFGPAKWKNASFKIEESTSEMTIRIK